MVSFIIGVILLVAGYFVWGKLSERIFVINPDAKTPALRMADGVDYVSLDWKRALLIQLLNIAGTGPIFGAIAGAMFGPAAFAWIVFGCIFAGAVHDYMVGMLSVRNDGKNIAEIVGKYLGKGPLYIMRVFSIVLLLFVGVVFVTTPAQVLQTMFSPVEQGQVIALFDQEFIPAERFYIICLACIFLYYILATLLPIDKLIGRLYPIFGACLLVMGIGLTIMMFATGDIQNVPEFSFINMRPDKTENIMAKIFPFLFITIACGAISGFHATQSPLMARCIKNEREGRKVFYLAMILEGIVAMIWAAVTLCYKDPATGTLVVGNLKAVAAPVVVTLASKGYMGWVGGILAVFGVVACPITSGDTAFRAVRLSIAEITGVDQKPIAKRLSIALPIFLAGLLLVLFSLSSVQNFNIVWRYFSWSNQTLATIGLWAASAYLAKTAKNYWITLLPAAFMTVVVVSYFFAANECIGPMMTQVLGSSAATYSVSVVIGLIAAIVLFALFVPLIGIKQKGVIKE